MMDTITFTITLPTNGMFDDQVAALRAARDTQARIGNVGGAQALAMILALSERGLLAYNTDAARPMVAP